MGMTNTHLTLLNKPHQCYFICHVRLNVSIWIGVFQVVNSLVTEFCFLSIFAPLKTEFGREKDLRFVSIIYRLIDEVLIGIFFDDPVLFFESKFWRNGTLRSFCMLKE